MNSGLLVVVALFLIYLAVSGKYACVTASARCIFGGEKLCACGTQTTAQGKTIAGQLPDAVRGGISAGRTIYEGAKEAIRGAREGVEIIRGK